MSEPEFLQIRNWDIYQHYHDPKKDMVWIKLYTRLLDDMDFEKLPENSQLHLIKLMLFAAKVGNKLPNCPKILSRKIGAKSKLNLCALTHWLEPYSRIILEDCLDQRREEKNEIREEKIKERESTAATAAPPLEKYPVLKAQKTELAGALREAHPKAKPLGDKDWLTLEALVRLDGYSEQDVVDTLKWMFTSAQQDATFWRGNVYGFTGLRKARDGATKFDRIHAAFKPQVRKLSTSNAGRNPFADQAPQMR